MSEQPELPELRIVETETLHPHEQVDSGREIRLIRQLQTEGFLKNPPVVLRVSEDPEKYVVLDGANRTMAFRSMGFPHMLVQVADEGLAVETWNHVLLGGTIDRLVEEIVGIEQLSVQPQRTEQAAKALADRQLLAYLALPTETAQAIRSEASDTAARVRQLGRLVDLTTGRFRRERTNAAGLDGLGSLYSDLSGLLVYPLFEVSDVIEVAAGGLLFPTGLTRFLISPRALHVNFPLALLADQSPIRTKQEVLDEWIRDRLDNRQIRYYGESTFLFDE